MNALNGRLRGYYATVASVGAGTISLPIQPPEAGIVWKILHAFGSHISGGARQGFWSFIDPVYSPAGCDISPYRSYADSDGSHLGEGAIAPRQGLAEPVWATYTRYPQWNVVATGAGDDAYIYCIVIEYLGTDSI